MNEWALAGAWSAAPMTGKGVLLLSAACQDTSMSATLRALSLPLEWAVEMERDGEQGWLVLGRWVVGRRKGSSLISLCFYLVVEMGSCGWWWRQWKSDWNCAWCNLPKHCKSHKPDSWLSAVGFIAQHGQEPPTVTGRGPLTDMQNSQFTTVIFAWFKEAGDFQNCATTETDLCESKCYTVTQPPRKDLCVPPKKAW